MKHVRAGGNSGQRWTHHMCSRPCAQSTATEPGHSRSLHPGGTQGSRGLKTPHRRPSQGMPGACGDSAVSAWAQDSARGVCSDCLDFASFACLQPGSHLNSALGCSPASLGAVHLTPGWAASSGA